MLYDDKKEIICTEVTISAIRREIVYINYCENCNKSFAVTEYEQATKEDIFYHCVYFKIANYCPFCGFLCSRFQAEALLKCARSEA